MKQLFHQHRSVLKFFAAGVVVLFFNLALLYLLTDILKNWYIVSSIVAYAFAVVLNFFLQKIWVFENNPSENVEKQFLVYSIAAVSNAIMNTVLLYVIVEYGHVHYLLSQVTVTLFLAIVNYYLNRNYIFA
jgi:putative flippase GtrA